MLDKRNTQKKEPTADEAQTACEGATPRKKDGCALLSPVFGGGDTESGVTWHKSYTTLLLKDEYRVKSLDKWWHTSVDAIIGFLQSFSYCLRWFDWGPTPISWQFAGLWFMDFYHSLEETTKTIFASLFLFGCLLDAVHSILWRNKRSTQIYMVF